jgi:hypothetical protein
VVFLRLIARVLRVGGNGPVAADDWIRAASECIEPLTTPARLSRRIAERAKRIIAHQGRFSQPSTKSRSTARFLLSEDFEDALHLFGLRSAAWGQGWDVYEGWVERWKRMHEMPVDEMERLRNGARRRRRGRRGRRRGGSADAGGGPDEGA